MKAYELATFTFTCVLPMLDEPGVQIEQYDEEQHGLLRDVFGNGPCWGAEPVGYVDEDATYDDCSD